MRCRHGGIQPCPRCTPRSSLAEHAQPRLGLRHIVRACAAGTVETRFGSKELQRTVRQTEVVVNEGLAVPFTLRILDERVQFLLIAPQLFIESRLVTKRGGQVVYHLNVQRRKGPFDNGVTIEHGQGGFQSMVVFVTVMQPFT